MFRKILYVIKKKKTVLLSLFIKNILTFLMLNFAYLSLNNKNASMMIIMNNENEVEKMNIRYQVHSVYVILRISKLSAWS